MKSAFRVTVVLVLLFAASNHEMLAQGKALRVFISADMEGIAGVVNAAQLGPGEFEYERFRKLMTGEVNAAIEGALAAGATKITVADSHGNGLSVLPEDLSPKARLIRSWPRPFEMMQGVEGGFDAVIFIGYHASINTPTAVRAHTMSSARFYDVRLNGKHASEAMLNAAIAGHFSVPVILISGDDAIIAEAQKTIDPNMVGVVVKQAIGYHSADNVAPEVARTMIRDGVQAGLAKLASFRPFVLSRPIRLEIAFKNMLNAEILAMLPNVDRIDGATIGFTGKDIVEVVKFISVVTQYDSKL